MNDDFVLKNRGFILRFEVRLATLLQVRDGIID